MRKYLLFVLLALLIGLPNFTHATLDLKVVLEQLTQKLKTSPLVISNLKITPNLPPKIDDLSGPKALKVGENGQWNLTVTDPENGPMAYYFWWGDSLDGEKTKPARLEGQDAQLITFNHTYKTAGTYTITAGALDNTNQMSKKTVTVEVK